MENIITSDSELLKNNILSSNYDKDKEIDKISNTFFYLIHSKIK